MNDEIQFQLAPGAKKLTSWKNEPDVLALKTDLEAAKPAQEEQLRKIQKWNDLLKVEGKAKPPNVKGRSKVQPKLIRRQAEWRYSALTEPFLSSDKTFKVNPITFEDAPAARQNELLLNWQFRTKLNRVKFVDDLVRADVDEGTAIARLGWCRYTVMIPSVVPVWAYFPIQDQARFDQFQQALALKQENPRGFKEGMDPAIQAAVDYYLETGDAVYAEQIGEEEVQEEKILENHPTVEILNPANVFVDPSCGGELKKALFVVVSFETNKADLLKEGDRYQNLDEVNWEGNTTLTQPDHETGTPDTFEFKDLSRKKVVAYEYWGFYDIDGDGSLKSIVATWIGDVLIRMEENPFPDGKLPFVVVPYLPKKRELYGEPDAELLEENQAILGAVTRGMIDLMGRSANGQQGFVKGMLDALNKRRFENGQDYEFNPGTNPRDGVIEHKFPEIPNSAMMMLGLQNQEAEALTGVKSFSGGLSGDAYGKVATGIRGMLDAASKREMAILRRLAKGMQEIGEKIIAMNAEFLSEEEVVRVTNEEFVVIRREDLKGNFDLQVDISTFEVDNEKAQDLGFMLQTLGPNMDPSISMMILSEIAELKRMPVLAQRLKTWRPQPDPVQEQVKQLELMKLEKEVQKLDSEIQLNMAKAQEVVAQSRQTQLDTVEQETGTKHARKIVEQQSQSRGNQNLEVTKALLKSRKPDERPGDVTAAIGSIALSDAMQEEQLLGSQQPAPIPPAAQDPRFNPNSRI